LKDGRTPIHIQRWAPADFQLDPFVQWALAAQRWDVYVLYRQFIDVSFTQGGSIPDDPAYLRAMCRFEEPDAAEKALEVCIEAGKIFREDGKLFHPRVRREVERELDFRTEQTNKARTGTSNYRAERARKAGLSSAAAREAKYGSAQPLARTRTASSNTPPSPAPSPAPAPAPIYQEGERSTGSPERVTEASALLAEVSTEANLDPSEVLSRASEWKGKGYVRLDTMTPARLEHTIVALRRWLRELRGEAQPGPPARAAPANERAQARQEAAEALIRGGLSGDLRSSVGGRDGAAGGLLHERGPDAGDGAPPRALLPGRPLGPDR